jgi:hypothetical protein
MRSLFAATTVPAHRNRRAADQPAGGVAPPAPAQGRRARGRPRRRHAPAYRLHDEGIEAVRAHLVQEWGQAAARFRLLADNDDRP